MRRLLAALFCLVPALVLAQPGPAPGNIVTPLATDFVPLYGRGTTGPLFGTVGNLVAPLIGLPNTWTAPQTFTGGAIVPTLPPGNNTTNAASTAFVQSALANLIVVPNTWTALQTFTAGMTVNAIAVNVTAGGCTQSPGARGPIYVCNDIPGNNAAGQAAGLEIWTGNNPVGSIGVGDTVQIFAYVDNTNSRHNIWNQNFIINQVPLAQGGNVSDARGVEFDVVAGIAPSTPLSAYTQGSWTHAAEAVCSQNGGSNPVPCQAAFWVWAAGDYANNSSSATQPWNFGFAASRVQFAGFDCEINPGGASDTGTYFKQGCLWDQSNSAISYQVDGTHTSIIDVVSATYTQFANCNATCGFTGKLSSSGGFVTTGNAGAIGLAASVVANALSGNPGLELQTAGVTRGYLAATGTLMQLYTNSAIQLKLGTNNTDAIIISGSQVIQVPAVSTGTPAASLCIDSSNNIIKKTTAGSCI